MDYQQLLQTMTPETYQRIKRAVELGKWPDGRRLTPEQREHAMQAVIAWDQMHLGETDRVGYIDKKHKAGDSCDNPLEAPLKWRGMEDKGE